MKYIETFLLLDGQVENLIYIIDLSCLEEKQIVFSLCQKVMNFNMKNFQARIYKYFFVKASKQVKEVAKTDTFFKELILSYKLRITRKARDPKLLDIIDYDQLLKEYGGNCEIPSKYWPPSIPSENFGTNPSKIMSNIEYKARIRANKYLNPRWDFAIYSSSSATQKQYNSNKRKFIISDSGFTKSESKEIKDSPNKKDILDKLNFEEEIKNISPAKRNHKLSSFAPRLSSDEDNKMSGSNVMIENKIESKDDNIKSIIPSLSAYNKLIEPAYKKSQSIQTSRKYTNHYSSFIQNPHNGFLSPPKKSGQNEFLLRSEGDKSEFQEETLSPKIQENPLPNIKEDENNNEKELNYFLNEYPSKVSIAQSCYNDYKRKESEEIIPKKINTVNKGNTNDIIKVKFDLKSKELPKVSFNLKTPIALPNASTNSPPQKRMKRRKANNKRSKPKKKEEDMNCVCNIF